MQTAVTGKDFEKDYPHFTLLKKSPLNMLEIKGKLPAYSLHPEDSSTKLAKLAHVNPHIPARSHTLDTCTYFFISSINFDKSIFNTDLISNKFNKFFKSFKVPQSSSVISWQKKKCKTSPHRFSTECGIMFTSTTFLMTSTLQLKYRYLIPPRVTKNTTFKTYLQVYMYNVFIGHP